MGGLGFYMYIMSCNAFLEGKGSSVNMLATPVTHVVTVVIPIIHLLTKEL